MLQHNGGGGASEAEGEILMSKEDIIDEVRESLKHSNLTDIALAFTKWRDYQQFTMSWELTPEKLMLIVTEAAEAMEAYRSEDVIGFSEELADIIIRTLDLAGGLGIDIHSEVANKMEKNFARPPKHNRKC